MKKRSRRIAKTGLSFVLSAATAFSGISLNGLEGILARAASFQDTQVLSLSFEDNLKDSSGKGNNGTATGTISYAEGVTGKGLKLTGAGYIELGTSETLQPANMTISFWLKAPEGGLKDEQMIMWNKDDGSWYSDGFYLGSASDSIPLELSAGASYSASGQPYKIGVEGNRDEFFPEGEWVHVTLTYDSSTKEMNVYRNGIKQKTVIEETDGDGIIGSTSAKKWLGTNSPKYGSKSIFEIDEYEIYSSVATEEEVIALYEKNGGKMDNASLIQADYDALEVAEEVSASLSLATEGTKGGSKIAWASSNPDVITETGVVTRPSAEEGDASVTLTATLTNGSETKTKTFDVTVKASNDFLGMSSFDMEDVVVTDEYEANAFQKDVDYLVSLDTDRLLAGFRENAAYAAGYSEDEVKEYMKNAVRYTGGWENSLIGGHTMGHYLSAMAQAYANPAITEEDKEKVSDIINEIIDSLAECQEMTKGSKVCNEGYLFGATLKSDFYENLEKQFDNVEEGKTNISTQAWVPWYTMHKIIAGLVDVYKQTGNEKALSIASNLGDWVYNRVSKWDTATQTKVLNIEYGGMNDCLYELYKYTKKETHAEAAHMFDETALFEKIKAGTSNVLSGKHANTTIPKLLGALNRYEALGESESQYLEYAEAFWDMVVEKHTYITGGSSNDEHFAADNTQNSKRSNVNNETCNTYNMLKLTRELFKITGEKKYADYYENTLQNSIMASQNPETGMMMYFQPMETGYQKVFCTAESSFWCCTGSGMENFTKLNDSIYFYKDNTVVVNQYISSELTWDEQNMKLVQDTDLLNSDTASFTVDTISGDTLNASIRLRIPDWAAGDVTVNVDGKETTYTKDTTEYVVIPSSDVKKGTKISITIPKTVEAYNLADSENTYAFKYGPYVLSAKLGTANQTTGSHGVSLKVPTTKAVEDDNISIQSADSVEEYMENIASNMVKTDGKMEFTLKGTNVDYVFVPHYSQYTESYGIYWTFSIDADGRSAEQVLSTKKAARFNDKKQGAIEAGYGQYEDGLTEENSVGDSTALTRYAKAGGYFQYEVAVKEGEDNYLLVTFAKEDDGKTMKISAAGKEIFNQKLNSASADIVNETLTEEEQKDYYQIAIKLPKDVIAGNTRTSSVDSSKTVVDVRFEGTASEDSAKVCGWLYSRTAYGTENSLKGLSVNRVTASGDSSAVTVKVSGNDYSVTVPSGTNAVNLSLQIADSKGYVSVDGIAIDETAEKQVELTGSTTKLAIKVYAEDFTTAKDYTLTITKAKKVKLSKTKLSLKAGKSAKLTVKNTKKKVTWTSSKKAVATVNKNGKVTAVKAGTCKITAKVGSKKLVCKVTVKKASKKK
jgi:DUF1680 family protein